MTHARRLLPTTSLIAAVLALLLAVGSFAILSAGVARADATAASTTPATPTTVAADALPTAQVNGVVWSQTVVGTTVYAAGRFTSARPAGAAPGTGETPRGNLLAYNITTGALVTGFAPNLNGQALVVTASPDGSRIYVGGDFTQADGQPRNRIAAYDTTTNSLVSSFHPSVSGQVHAIAATNSTVYLGGSVSAVGSVSRTRLAAVSAADGSLLPWAPVPGPGPTSGNNDPNKTAAQNATPDYDVMAMVLTGGGSQVVASGRFDTLNGVKSTGVGALDPVTGATRPFAVNQLITNQGINSAIDSLSTDGTTVYGTAYDFYGPGDLEGAFEVTADGGNLIEVDDCHGDTYSSYATGQVLYLSSHAHECGDLGGFPEQNPRINKFATAFTTTPMGTVGPGDPSFSGQPAPSLLNWFPTLTAGTFTGQNQAGWSVAGNNQYVVYGGEFPKVNGTAQQGLVRFAVRSIAPNKVGPSTSAGLTPTLVNMSSGLRVTWQTTSDQDDSNLTYEVIRSDQPNSPVYRTTASSTWWNRPTLGFIDRTVHSGTTYSYRVRVTDPWGNVVSGTSASTTATAAGSSDLYSSAVLGDNPADYWRLDEAAGTGKSYDQAGFNDLTLSSGVSEPVPGALTGSSDTAASFDGSTSGLAATTSPVAGPQVFSVEAWFSTTSTAGGKIVGFGNASTGNSSSYDRHVYMDASGRVNFGVYPGFTATVQSSRSYNDGTWHHVVGTLGSGGMALYLDGQLVGQRSDVTTAQDYAGYWRVGGDSTWADAQYFAGNVDEVAVYGSVLSANQVARHFAIGSTGQPYNNPPTASFTSSASGLTVALDGSASSDAEGPIAGYAWNFGDGTTGTGAKVSHTFAGGGSYRVTLTVTDSGGKQATATHVVGVSPSGTSGGAYSQAVVADGASAYWRLGETSGAALDSVGTDDLAVGSGVTRDVAGAISGDADGAAGFDGSVNGLAAEQTAAPAPNTFSLEAWFNTTSTAGGKIVGYGDQSSGYSSNYDRHIYMTPDGAVHFGVWTGSETTVQTAPGLNDGAWHHVVASLSSSGLALYLDGNLVGTNTSTSTGQSYTGYWRIGGDSDWDGAGAFFAGSIDDVAVYPTALSATQVAQHHQLGASAQPANVPPTAAFTSSMSNLTVAVDGSGSSDPDGTVASWAWDFGDGQTGTGATASHTYAAAGQYTVTLVVTDDRGATGTVSHQVTATAANVPPTAAFTSSMSNLTVAVDGSGSSDPDGTVASWAWDFGDGQTGTGATASHTYAAAGQYTVTLVVTDDHGATGTVSHQVTATAPAGPAVVAKDGFGRTVTGGLGTADVGGAWTASYGAARQSVSPGAATLNLAAAGNLTASYLGGVSQTDSDTLTSVSLGSAPTGGGVSVYVTGRRVAANQEYRARLRFLANGSVAVAFTRLAGSATETVIGSEVTLPGLTYSPGSSLAVRVRVVGTGTTQLSVTVWSAGSTEPATPTLTRTDTTASLQAAGGLGLSAYLSSSATAAEAVRFGAYQVTAD